VFDRDARVGIAFHPKTGDEVDAVVIRFNEFMFCGTADRRHDPIHLSTLRVGPGLPLIRQEDDQQDNDDYGTDSVDQHALVGHGLLLIDGVSSTSTPARLQIRVSGTVNVCMIVNTGASWSKLVRCSALLFRIRGRDKR
jgi:hypothetical protein